MVRRILVKLVRFWGWTLCILSLCVVIAGLLANSGESVEFGIIGFFAGLGAVGFLLTRFKKEKRPKSKSLRSPPTKHRKAAPAERAACAPPPSAVFRRADVVGTAPAPVTEVVETSRKEIGIPSGKIFHIWYEDSNGNVSERDIEILKFSQKGEKIYIHAFCHSRQAVRTFLMDRIIEITENGQEVNFMNYLEQGFVPVSTDDMASQALEDIA